MNFPSKEDFLEEFGIEPVVEDFDSGLLAYQMMSNDGHLALTFSFSGVMRSFQVNFKFGSRDLVVLSAEQVKSIGFIRDISGVGINVIFDIKGSTAEAKVMFEPEIHCHWWILKY